MRALFLFARSLKRIAVALEALEQLYRLDCQSRGIIQTKPGIKDEVEVSYEAKPEQPETIWDR